MGRASRGLIALALVTACGQESSGDASSKGDGGSGNGVAGSSQAGDGGFGGTSGGPSSVGGTGGVATAGAGAQEGVGGSSAGSGGATAGVGGSLPTLDMCPETPPSLNWPESECYEEIYTGPSICRYERDPCPDVLKCARFPLPVQDSEPTMWENVGPQTGDACDTPGRVCEYRYLDYCAESFCNLLNTATCGADMLWASVVVREEAAGF